MGKCKYSFIFILILLTSLSLSLHAVYARPIDPYAFKDYLSKYYGIENNLPFIIYGQTAYVAYREDNNLFPHNYGVAAYTLHYGNDPELTWSLPIPDCIEALTLENECLFIFTSTCGIWSINLSSDESVKKGPPRNRLIDFFSTSLPLSPAPVYEIPVTLPFSSGSAQNNYFNFSPLTALPTQSQLPFGDYTIPDLSSTQIPGITIPTLTIGRYREPVVINLALDNPRKVSLDGQLTLTLKNLAGQTISRETTPVTLEPGIASYPFILNQVPAGTDTEDFVKYIISFVFTSGGFSISGEKNLFHVADKLEVLLIGPDSFYADQPTAIGIHAFVHGQPVPIGGADVTVELIADNRAIRVFEEDTDKNGLAEVVITIPKDAPGKKRIRARVSSDLGTEQIEEDIEIIRASTILLTTDKPIYQPGHTIHIRTLTLRKPDLIPEAGKDTIIEVEDAKGNKVFRVNPTNDAFGVASADFVLGSDIILGSYSIRAIAMLGDEDQTISEKRVAVERYVLPKFRIELTTDADFYAPGDTVEGTIQADYFFGKPVSEATVTIEASKFDVEFVTFQTINGQTDKEGFFSFDLTLPSYFVGLPIEQGDAFVELEVKVKDSADHEESIVKELTVSKEPIHVHIIPESGEIVEGVENILYIITTDPLGQGLATTNLISFEGEIFDMNTDNQGLGTIKVTPSQGSRLLFHIASQADGMSSVTEINLAEHIGEAKILLRTDKAVYTVGQSMIINVYTPEQMGRRIFLDIIKEGQTILTKGIDISNGKGEHIIDIDHTMAGTLLVEAYYISLAQETASDIFRDKKIVYVNPADEISIIAHLDKEVYLPGDTAKIELQVDPPQAAALGVSIVDEAVYALQENRPALLKVYFTMEAEIMKPRFWPLLVPFEEAVTCPDPEEEVQEMTEVAFALAEEPADPGISESSYPNLIKRAKLTMVSLIDQDLTQIIQDTEESDLYSFQTYKLGLGQAIQRSSDPWGNNYKVNEIKENQVVVLSSGPDEVFGTMDDISVTKPFEKKWTPVDRGYDAGLIGRNIVPPYIYPFGIYAGPFGYTPLWDRTTRDSSGFFPQSYSSFGMGPTYAWGSAGGLAGSATMLTGYSASSYTQNIAAAGGGYAYGLYGGVGGEYAAYGSYPGESGGYAASEGKYSLESQTGYLTPTYEVTEKVTDTHEVMQEPRKVRRDFPETLLWEPLLITNSEGKAYLDADMADSITTWRMSTLASTMAGKLGGSTEGIVVFQDFFIDIDLPVALTQNDEISLPIAIYNYLSEAQSVKVKMEVDPETPWFELKDMQEKQIELQPGQVTAVHFRMKALQVGWHELTVFGYGTRMSDAISRKIEIVPDGKEFNVNVSARLGEKGAHHVISFPSDAIEDASKILVKVYPGIFSQVVEGLDTLFQVPYG
ncbi:MAG: MG2 domain-containing protein [bacterium]